MQRRRHRRLFLIALLGLGILLAYNWLAPGFQGSVASAHSFVVGSDPVDGDTVFPAPAKVRIFFDAPISSASVAQVFDPAGQRVDVKSVVVGNNAQELDTPLANPEKLALGSYIVRWMALANYDGHITHGVIGFNVGQSSVGLPGQVILGPSTSNSPIEINLIGTLSVAWEWLVLMALTFWVGILVTEGFVLAGVERTANLLIRTSERARPLQWLCLSALLVGEIITLILRATLFAQTFNDSGVTLSALQQIILSTNYGYLWLTRVALIVLALIVFALATRSRSTTEPAQQARNRFGQLRAQALQISDASKAESLTSVSVTPSRTLTTIQLILAGLIMLTLAFTGDAAQLDKPFVGAILLDWLRLVSQSIWLGTLAYLGYVLLPQLRNVSLDPHAEMLVSVLRRFTPLSLIALGVLLITGFLLSMASLHSAQLLLTDPYGRALLVELIVFTIMLLLTIYTLFLLRPRLLRQAVLLPVVDAELPARRTRQSALEQTERTLKRALSVQSWLGAGVLLCLALMAFYAPPIVFPSTIYKLSITDVSSTSTTTGSVQTQQVGNLSVTLRVSPGKTDYANTVLVTITDSNGKPVTDAKVQFSINMVIMDMGTTYRVLDNGTAGYVTTFEKGNAFSMLGAWAVTLSIQQPGQNPVQVRFVVNVTA